MEVQIDSFSSITSENDLAAIRCVDKICNFSSCVLICISSLCAGANEIGRYVSKDTECVNTNS